jgi:release factor glutamine methyltransferase
MTIYLAEQALTEALTTIYDSREATQIAYWVMEHVTGKKKSERIIHKSAELPDNQLAAIEQIQTQLLQHRPIQYILGEAWFMGMNFFVNESVLIPRPETEELVSWVIDEHKNKSPLQILDIGTGSGCIGISLQKNLPSSKVTLLDISEDALGIAAGNAKKLGATVQTQQLDILDESAWASLPIYDVIVSNPPYIKKTEAESMAKHVLDFEPSLALFVEDDDALIFYRKIALLAVRHLASNGVLNFEINEMLGEEVVVLLEELGFSAQLRKDLQGKNRMVRAILGD